MSENSAVQFRGQARIHIGLAVTNLASATHFYEQLLGSPPVKQRPGYAKFEIEEPSVNLSLNEVSASEYAERSRTHYGVQVKSTDAVRAAAERLRAAEIPVREELETACCYAVQDKIWIADPDGHRWEIFVVTEAEAPARSSQSGDAGEPACCVGSASGCC